MRHGTNPINKFSTPADFESKRVGYKRVPLLLTGGFELSSWDSAYTRDLRNNEDDADDEGTVWFSESGAEEAVLRELNRLEDDRVLFRGSETSYHHGANAPQASRFLDLGTGNGHMLFTLRDDNDDASGGAWHGELVGIDYSEASVALARQIAAQRRCEAVRFEQWDLLTDQPGGWLHDGFDVVLDKGTFDAISLMPRSTNTEHPCDLYRRKVVDLVKPDRFLFVTSCNWTKDELLGWLAPAAGELELYGEARYPTYTFGGRTGQSVVTVIFRRKAAS